MPTTDVFPCARLLALIRTRGPRLARFACTGGLAAVIQLGLLHLWTARGWNAIVANAVAFFVAAQVNFALSATVTWGDRRDALHPRETLLRRWLSFHGTIFSTALLNQAIFALARTAMPDLPAAGFGIAAAAFVNFVMLDRVIFRPRRAA